MGPCSGSLRDQAGPAIIRAPINQEKQRAMGENYRREGRNQDKKQLGRIINNEKCLPFASTIKAVFRKGAKAVASRRP